MTPQKLAVGGSKVRDLVTGVVVERSLAGLDVLPFLGISRRLLPTRSSVSAISLFHYIFSQAYMRFRFTESFLARRNLGYTG